MVAMHNLRHRHNERGRHMLRRAGYKGGGRVKGDEAEDKELVAEGVHEHEGHMHKGEKKTKLFPKKAEGGPVSGRQPHNRLDRKPRGGTSSAGPTKTQDLKTLNETPEFTNDYARGGRTKGKGHNISIKVVTPAQGGGAAGGPQQAQQAFQAGVLVGAQAAKRAQMGAAGPGMPPGGPGGPPPGAMPPHPMAAPGGGGMPPGGPPPAAAGAIPPIPGRPPMKRGGRTCAGMKTGGRVHMTAGAGSGEGRLQKTELQKRKD